MFCTTNTSSSTSGTFSMGSAKTQAFGGLSKRLDDYTFLKRLGEGSYGTVWLSETVIASGERALAAVKVVQRAKLANDDEFVFQMHEEQHLIKFFTDTDPGLGYIPHLIESFTDESNYYIVQEYISGGTLREEMDRNGGKLPLDRAKFVLAQLMTIVGHMHQLGVMHRDIKPDNILLDAVGNIVLTDLGLSGRFSALRETEEGLAPTGPLLMSNKACGTPNYAAPEVLYHEYYTFPVDMYSLGVLFYEMVFGFLPFEYDDLSHAAYAKKKGLFEIKSDGLDDATVDILLRLVEKDPKHRMTAWDAVYHPYFEGVDWRHIATRTYELPVEWAPLIARIDFNRTIDKGFLLDMSMVQTPFGRRRLTPLDRAFTTPRRAPSVMRPVPPRQVQQAEKTEPCSCHKIVDSLVITDMRRGTPQSSSPALQPGNEADDEVEDVDGLSAKAFESMDCADEVVEYMTPDCTSLVPVPARMPAIDVPNALAEHAEHTPTPEYSAFVIPIELLDDILLSAFAGMGPGHALALQALPSLPSPPTSAFSPMQIVQGHLAPPAVPALDRLGPSPPVTPGPVTPVSGRSRAPSFELNSKARD